MSLVSRPDHVRRRDGIGRPAAGAGSGAVKDDDAVGSIGVRGDATVVRRPGSEQIDPQRTARRRTWKDFALRVGTPIILIGAWQVLVVTTGVDRRYWPAPTDVIGALVTTIQSGLLWDATWITLVRILTGFAMGTVVGLVVGLAMGTSRTLRVAIDPIISALYTIPKLAILPVLLLIFGLGETPKLLLIAFGTFFIVTIATTGAVSGVPDSYLEPARSFGASQLQKFRHVVIPAALPEIFTSLRIAMGIAVLLAVGVEIVGGTDGLGFLIWNSWQVLLADRMYAGIVTVSLLGVILQGSIPFIKSRVAPWTRVNKNQ